GHAIEVRLYAEDPAADYQPQSGGLTTFEIPTGPGIRVDTGFESGSEVSTHYDAMLAKVIVAEATRAAAARKLAGVLRRSRIHGLTTNRDQLVGVLLSDDFLAGRVSTAFLDEHEAPAPPGSAAASVAAAIALAEHAVAARTVQRGLPVAWRNVPSQPQVTELEVAEGTVEQVAWWGDRDGYRIEGYEVLSASSTNVGLAVDGVATYWNVQIAAPSPGAPREIHVDGPDCHVRLREVPRFVDPADAVASGSLLAPMPGTVVKVAVEAGQQVAAGDQVLVLEAMKMQHTVSAPTAGVVTEINVKPGTQVAAGEVLAVVEEEGDPS
ncbi:MAG: biotin/lipoyl-containing protein, partial [Nocardioides sp.]